MIMLILTNYLIALFSGSKYHYPYLAEAQSVQTTCKPGYSRNILRWLGHSLKCLEMELCCTTETKPMKHLETSFPPVGYSRGKMTFAHK